MSNGPVCRDSKKLTQEWYDKATAADSDSGTQISPTEVAELQAAYEANGVPDESDCFYSGQTHYMMPGENRYFPKLGYATSIPHTALRDYAREGAMEKSPVLDLDKTRIDSLKASYKKVFENWDATIDGYTFEDDHLTIKVQFTSPPYIADPSALMVETYVDGKYQNLSDSAKAALLERLIAVQQQNETQALPLPSNERLANRSERGRLYADRHQFWQEVSTWSDQRIPPAESSFTTEEAYSKIKYREALRRTLTSAERGYEDAGWKEEMTTLAGKGKISPEKLAADIALIDAKYAPQHLAQAIRSYDGELERLTVRARRGEYDPSYEADHLKELAAPASKTDEIEADLKTLEELKQTEGKTALAVAYQRLIADEASHAVRFGHFNEMGIKLAAKDAGIDPTEALGKLAELVKIAEKKGILPTKPQYLDEPADF